MSWVDIAVGAGGSATALGILGTLIISQAKHAVRRVVDEVVTEAVQPVKHDLTALRVKIASETGGNNHGLRQAVDEIGKDVSHIKGYLNLPQ